MQSLYLTLLLFAAITSSFASYVFDLDANSFDHYAHDKDIMLVDFFAPWCSHCKMLAPELETAANTLASKNHYVFAKVDCIAPQNEALCKKFDIQGYPSLKLFKFGQYSGDYIGGRTTNDLVTYMDSVTETSAQKAPLTTDGPGFFAASLGASPQAYINPQQVQFQPAPNPQTYPVPQPGLAAPSFFNSPLSAPSSPSLINSFYNTNTRPSNNPAVAAYAAANQPSTQATAPDVHVGASPDSLQGKFGGNLLALDILRAKLKMIAAYKNWQKRLKEYKEKMTDAAMMNYNNQHKAFSTKHVIHRPAPAAILKAKAFLRKSKSSVFQKKYPRTYQNSIHRPVAAIKPASYRRGFVYGRQTYQPQPATAYQQPYSAYKRYYAYKQQQRQKIQRLQQQQRRQKIQRLQQQQQRQKIQRLQQQQQRQKIQQQKVQRQKIQRLQQQQRQQRQKIERLQQYQPEYQRAYDRSFITRPQTQEVNPNPNAAIQQEESQADKSAIIQPKPQDLTTDQFQGQVTNDVRQEEKKKQTLSSDTDTPSIKDLKQDIQSAIQDALKTTSGNTKVVTKPAVPAVVAAVGSKTLDLSGSGLGDDHSSGLGDIHSSGSGDNHSSGSGDNRISGSHIADMSGSGSGSKGVTSGSGSGAAVTSKKSNDKTSGES